MSHLQKDLFLRKIQDRENKLKSLGSFPQEEEDEEEEEGDELGELGMPSSRQKLRGLEKQSASDDKSKSNHISLSSLSSLAPTSTNVPSSSKTSNSKYSQLRWNDYFTEEFTVTVVRQSHQSSDQSTDPSSNSLNPPVKKIKKIDFNVYFTPPSDLASMPVFAFHHGAGSCGLSFACVSRDLRTVFQNDGASPTSSPGMGPATGSSGSFPGMGIGSLSAVAPFGNTPSHAGSAQDLLPIPGMIPMPGSGLPATVFPGAKLPFAPTPFPGSSPTTSPPSSSSPTSSGILTGLPGKAAGVPNEDSGKAKDTPGTGTPGIIAFDVRYHGKTKVYDQNTNENGQLEYTEEQFKDMDMSLESLAMDFVDVVRKVYELKGWKRQEAYENEKGELDEDDGDTDTEESVNKKKHTQTGLPNLILVGHSLGGSVVTSSATLSFENSQKLSSIDSKAETCLANAYPEFPAPLTGVGVFDVVEGTAIESLSTMNMILDSRPKSFSSVEKGIEWHVRSKSIRNLESARVSVPGLLRPQPLKNPSSPTTSSSTAAFNLSFKPLLPPPPPSPSSIFSSGGTAISGGRFEWITNLSTTAPFWKGWFTGLSNRFLKVGAARLLVLAGTDRLDKELMIGQMQGKYQLVVFQDAGHFLHEDVPNKTAILLYDFWQRNDRSKQIVPVFGKLRNE